MPRHDRHTPRARPTNKPGTHGPTQPATTPPKVSHQRIADTLGSPTALAHNEQLNTPTPNLSPEARKRAQHRTQELPARSAPAGIARNRNPRKAAHDGR